MKCVRTQRVVVCGYPKSGTSWLTKLTADLLECPVSGMWRGGSRHPFKSAEDNSVNFECYKSHLPVFKIQNNRTNRYNADKIIYIVRDPRDVIISAAHYFNTSSHYLKWQSVFKKLRIRRIASFLLNRTDYQVALECVTKGGKIVNMEIPWHEHVLGFLETEHLIVRYEDLLSNPQDELKNIQEYVGVNLEKPKLEKIIRKHSFNRKKNKYKRDGNKKGLQFLRAGESGQWEKRLTSCQVQEVSNACNSTLHRLGYETHENI